MIITRNIKFLFDSTEINEPMWINESSMVRRGNFAETDFVSRPFNEKELQRGAINSSLNLLFIKLGTLIKDTGTKGGT
jgi:hypothetical protein